VGVAKSGRIELNRTFVPTCFHFDHNKIVLCGAVGVETAVQFIKILKNTHLKYILIGFIEVQGIEK